jgi:lipopolysaccharide transport system ATP-binding protein
MAEVLLRATGVGKSYPATDRAMGRLRAMLNILAGRGQAAAARHEVLRDVSLDVHAGQSIGIIGENGAGKSTLLKLLSGVSKPTTGSIERLGSQAALIELSAGFDQEVSGFDNIFLKTALMGMSVRQTRKHLDAIIEFADIGDALQQPVKTYSSGMVVRLGFAIVAIQNPQLLMTDEVLAVGDESFQRKCIGWLDNYLADGGTLLMVSHSTYQIKRLCPQCLWIHDHHVAMYGDSDRVINAYLDWHAEKQQQGDKKAPRALNPDQYQVVSMLLLDAEQQAVNNITSGDSMAIELHLSSPDGRKPVAGFGIIDRAGLAVYGVASTAADNAGERISELEWRFRVNFPALPLLPGSYTVRAHVLDPEGVRVCDSMETRLTVSGSSLELGTVRLQHDWH